jgi:CubicO group peptidase (beta-lactamase class C family)
LLQAVVERATGKPFAAALDDLVFKPAGMPNTGLWPVTAIVPNRAHGYLHAEDDPLGLGPRYSNEQFLGYGANGSGGEFSPAAGTILSSDTRAAEQTAAFRRSPIACWIATGP